MRGRHWAGILAGSVAAISVACSGGEVTPAPDGGTSETDASPTVPQIPAPTGSPSSFAVDRAGPYNVGHRSFDVTYTPPGGQPSRTIPVEIWYPTLDAQGETTRYGGIFTDDTVFEGASAAPPADAAGYPVHVYSHGSAGFAGTASKTSRYFASHGWVVAAPNHVGNLLKDGNAKRPLAISFLRSTDVTAAIDGLEKLAAPDPLAGKLRTSRVLLSGHSFGAFTAWASSGVSFDQKVLETRCASDEFSVPCKPEELAVFQKGLGDRRVVAAVPMAGGASDSVADYGAVKLPVLLMSGTLDVSAGPIYDRAGAIDVTWLELVGGCHEAFALGGCKELDEKLAWSLVSTHILAFGRRYVLGDATQDVSAIVTGERSLSEVVRFKHKGPISPPSGF